jgi:hypothetical protein
MCNREIGRATLVGSRCFTFRKLLWANAFPHVYDGDSRHIWYHYHSLIAGRSMRFLYYARSPSSICYSSHRQSVCSHTSKLSQHCRPACSQTGTFQGCFSTQSNYRPTTSTSLPPLPRRSPLPYCSDVYESLVDEQSHWDYSSHLPQQSR